MARHEVAHGQNPDAVKMAKIIVDWQQLEIGQMTKCGQASRSNRQPDG